MSPDIVLADFFSGCGGTTFGFAEAGIVPALAIDWDADAATTFRLNFPETTVFERDICELGVDEVRDALPMLSQSVTLFAGCAPCQPFAGHRRKTFDQDSRRFLLLEFLRFVRVLDPELVFVENVPGIQRPSTTHGPFAEFLAGLSRTYHVSYAKISSADYGVPQMRRRLVLLASRLGPIDIPAPTHGQATGRPYSTVREWIGSLPPITDGQHVPEADSHRAMRLSKLNLERIRATPEGGDRRDWPKRLWPPCHRGGFDGHTDVYGRLSWDKPAPTLTTKCISYSNGRFGHPSQDRALSAREAARLQTFPGSFKFAGSLTSQARQIGNAVPVVLAHHFGRHLVDHVAAAHRTSAAPRGAPASSERARAARPAA
ncbi:MAG: DNA cytosine methyltransferase [Acidimicrobiaceae bacterium]|nr:DNA cytosine methyltransferase [Acidimicrobiaceae bacterium]MYB87143.1 DNA cytosine methyltransferase [Acidimicrobiaceae bacterium]MYH93974.1 DNA cytosine methyltransferase [Acidimicrobiaceae bacterium]